MWSQVKGSAMRCLNYQIALRAEILCHRCLELPISVTIRSWPLQRASERATNRRTDRPEITPPSTSVRQTHVPSSHTRDTDDDLWKRARDDQNEASRSKFRGQNGFQRESGWIDCMGQSDFGGQGIILTRAKFVDKI